MNDITVSRDRWSSRGIRIGIIGALARLTGCLAVVLTLATGGALPASGQDLYRAAAVVNDEVISVLDVIMRTRLAVVASGLPDTREVRSRFQRQVLRGLIDERIQLQEAARLDISVTDDQLDEAVELLARQNNLSRERFVEALTTKQVLPSALMAQVRGEIVWRTLVDRRLRPTIDISEEEVDEIILRLASRTGRQQHRVSEIFLGVDSISQDDEVRRSAERLIEQLRQGADFGALAQQFSQSATASVGGDLGWVEPAQLPEELGKALAKMKTGQIVGPLRGFGGYYIAWLRDTRQITMGNAELDLTQVLFPLSGDATESQAEDALEDAAALRDRISGCESVADLAGAFDSAATTDLGRIKLADLPPNISREVAIVPAGQASNPIRLPAGMAILVVCEREDGGINRNRIRSTLLNQRLDMLSRRYLRDLRRSANVDIRL